MAQFQIFYPDEGCQWLDCSRGKRFGDFCLIHKKRGEGLKGLRQCSFYSKTGLGLTYCLTPTNLIFNGRYFCSEHHKELKKYEEEIKENMRVLREKGKEKGDI